MLLISWMIVRLLKLFKSLISSRPNYFNKTKASNCNKPKANYARNRKKPQWVVDKVIYLKAMMPDTGCGTIANTFNRISLNKGETVSKTYVYEKLKTHQYQVKCKRREIKNRKPKAMPINQTWAMDLTTVNIGGKRQIILGIIDHGSRALLCLQALDSKHSFVILNEIINTIKLFGFPKRLRSDNEVCFTSRLIKVCLAFLSIKQQTTDVACPWQNGRIERCFGTFKHKWQQAHFTNADQLQQQLVIYQTWYSSIRPHSHLDGRTPAEVHQSKTPKGKAIEVTGWDGVLSGYYFPD